MSLTIKLQPGLKQDLAYEALFDDDVSYILFGGGAGGGKSWLLCEWQMIQRIRYPGTKGFIARNELKRLMQSTYVTLLKVHEWHGITQDMWRLDGKYNFIEYYNGSRIDLIDVAPQPSDPMYQRLGSLEYTDGAIEEAGEVAFMAFDILKSRIGRQKNQEYGIKPKILLTCNPNKGWLYQKVYKPWKAGTLDSSWTFIQSLSKDNKHAGEDYGKQLDSIEDNATRERLRDGNWEYTDDETQLMSFEAISDLFTNTLGKQDGRRFITVDAARYGSDLVTVFVWDGFEAIDVSWFSKKSTIETAQLVRDKEIRFEVPRSQTLVDEDGIGGGVVDALPGCKGFHGGASALPDKDGNQDNFQNLKAQCSYKIASLVQGHQLAIRTSDQFMRERITEELQQIRRKNRDKDGKLAVVPKDEVKLSLGRSPDFADAIMMRAYFELNKKAERIIEVMSPLQREFFANKKAKYGSISSKF